DVAAVALCYAIYLGAMAAIGVHIGMGPAYFVGLALACILVLRHLAWIRLREHGQCFRAFLDNHWLGFTVFAAIVVDFALRLHRWPGAW
ncbi:MAG TPA: 4-hydroxybenzoate octaprenyltransferase, partial [Casimicrobiaceae bacterium]